ncbi:MAG: hypothetical protein EZS28_026221 [Streblomastix strix]|uniref:Uncharacterized protein n=1 Tax=Streblomastix strix TaxID=222440 RepID=A0A5J4V743_9EUKA|nr:MAG: hypothetical protein EZS28_026221 [Streblomastix strix]
MVLALVRAVYFCTLRIRAENNLLESKTTSEFIGINNSTDRTDKFYRQLCIAPVCNGHGPTYDRKKFSNALQSDKPMPNSCQICFNT